MGRRPKNRRHRNRCWMCKFEKLHGRLTRQELKSALDEKEQRKEVD